MSLEAVLKIIKASRALFSRGRNNDSGGKKVGISILIISMVLVLTPAATLSVPGLIFKGIISKVCSFFTGKDEEPDGSKLEDVDFDSIEIDENFDITKAEIYKLVKDVYIEFNTTLDTELNEYIDEITKQYTYSYEKTSLVDKCDDDGNVILDAEGNAVKEEKTETIEVKPEIKKSIKYTKPEFPLVLAYISTTQEDIVCEGDQYIFDNDEVLTFLRSVTDIHKDAFLIHDSSDGTPKEIYCSVYTDIHSAEQVSVEQFTEEKYPDTYQDMQQLYVFSYDSLSDSNDQEIIDSYEYIDLSSFNIHPNGMEIPHYLQYDSRWNSIPYGGEFVKNKGCGPSCIAMIASYFNQITITPGEVAIWAGDRYYTPGVGSSWTIFPAAASNYGFKCHELGVNSKKVVEALSSGQPVIASMHAGTFTSGNHFIVLRGITEEGKILVNDPNDNTYEKNFAKMEFELSRIVNEAKNFWAFSK